MKNHSERAGAGEWEDGGDCVFLGKEDQIRNEDIEHPREPGWLSMWAEERGLKRSIPDDFNESLEDLKDYM